MNAFDFNMKEKSKNELQFCRIIALQDTIIRYIANNLYFNITLQDDVTREQVLYG